MAGLTQQDIQVLAYYAKDGNRELYWNYLAQTPGNDGYGLLALGVVRNDNMPGKIANQYAQYQASSVNGKRLSEREWGEFGQDLVERDFAYRYTHFVNGRQNLALNLPVNAIQQAREHIATTAAKTLRWCRLAGMGLLALSLSACSQPARVAPVEKPAEALQGTQAEQATKATGGTQSTEAVSPMSAPCIKRVPKPYQWEGYNDKLVDACIGPTHYRFPANLFRDQMGPDFQAGIYMVLLWPDLQAAPPGKLNLEPLASAPNWIGISVDHVDRVPVETLLERYISPSESQVRENDPTAILALRDRKPERFGLTPYFVNPTLFEAREDRRQRETGSKFRAPRRNIDDWYLSRDASGRLTTLIKCDSHLRPEGYVAEGGTLVKVPNVRTNALCTHYIVMDDVKASVEISYHRELLHEWKRFEDRARELFATHRVR